MEITREQRKDFVSLEGLKIQRQAEGEARSIKLSGVKLLGYESKNGRRYVKPSPALYEGVKINLNHPDMFSGLTQVENTIGFTSNITVNEDGVFGDITLNPHHPAAEQIAWVAENAPSTMGMSHVAHVEELEVEGDFSGDIPLLEVIEVVSVDLVGRPATTNGMFEQQEDAPMKERIAELEAEVTALKASIAVAEENTRQEKLSHEATKAEQLKSESDAERKSLLKDAGLEEAGVALVEAVLGAKDLDAAKALIESITVAKTNKPKSKAQTEESAGDKVPPKTYEQIKADGGFSYKAGV
jgi:hypothetical protein